MVKIKLTIYAVRTFALELLVYYVFSESVLELHVFDRFVILGGYISY